MKELQKILTEVAHFKAKRENLAQALKNVDQSHRQRAEALENEHVAKVRTLETERQAAISDIEARTKKTVADYVQMKNGLQKYVASVRQWCSRNAMADYVPNPAKINEAELNQLIQMLQEDGLLAWLKRTFKLDGYSSRSEMALKLCRKIEDACAYCDERIAAAQSLAETDRGNQITETRRKLAAETERHSTAKHQLYVRRKEDKEQALVAIGKFDTSAELADIYARIKQNQAQATASCGVWGEYAIPTEMPDRVLLCNAKVSLPNGHGTDEDMSLPIWADLYETNIIVVSSSVSNSHSESKAKEFVRQFLARMLKTIPPGNCSYSIFDPLHKGSSLERLVDITNIGTTDLHFDLFTSNESDTKVVSCAERRKYLRNLPAEIIKYIAGRSKSLFEHNRQTLDFQFPFTWYIDFNFPATPDSKHLDDLKELFVNSYTAGYSFVFVTTPDGFRQISTLANQYANAKITHIDIDKAVCTKDNIQVEYLGSAAPKPDQIYNFTSALKKFYDDGGSINNRLDAVFSKSGLALRDASKKLAIPMAIDSRGRLIDLELGGDGSVHGFISGGTNSGKSTLLHAIIMSACLHYRPDDLEIWLVDYKQTEFHLYKQETPPHIKLIGVSKTADFTFSLLDKIEAEASRRTQLINLFNERDMEGYRKHKGEPGYVHFPRLFIIVDEFHEMSQFVAPENEYKEKLENILREYRAQGITCLLADQTFSTGLSGLTQPAKNQIGLRIAMRNEASIQEIKATLEVDNALYSDSIYQTMAIMGQGDFIMKVNIRTPKSILTGIKLEKFRALHAMKEDIVPVAQALKTFYRGQYTDNVLYVNTKDQAIWDDAELMALDAVEPLRYPNIRLYLGRSATLRPCFGLDIGRQPNENLSIVGGTTYQRWELIASIIKSCQFRKYKLIVFMAQYSDLMCDHAEEIRSMCSQIPNAELYETTEAWCEKLLTLEHLVDTKQSTEDTICLFIGLDLANIEMGRLPEREQAPSNFGNQLIAKMARYGIPVEDDDATAPTPASQPQTEFNALPIIDKLFSTGARNGIRCVTEVSVYRQFAQILNLKEMCRHRIAFSMSADDCLMYLGSSSFQKSIGHNAVYCDGGKEVKKLLPYKLEKTE